MNIYLQLSIVFIFLLTSSAFSSSLGEIIKVQGRNEDISLIRNSGNIKAATGEKLLVGDRIETKKSIIQVLIYPGTQINIAHNSSFTISNIDAQKKSIFELIKGEIRVLVKKINNESIDQAYRADRVQFGVRGTEFSIIHKIDEVDVSLFQGTLSATELTKNLDLGQINSLERYVFYKNKSIQNWLKKPFLQRSNMLEFNSTTILQEEIQQSLLDNNPSNLLDPRNSPSLLNNNGLSN